jgi:spermidine synthase
MTRLLYLIFFASGATGLVYEVIWVRLTGLVFGNTSFSIATVLGAFMAGLALGSWWLGRLADRVERPLRLYGVLEILIGISAFLVPFAFQSVDTVYWRIAPSLEAIAGADLVVRFLSSFAIMVVPTFLMGGTLPILGRYFVRSTAEVESRLGTLYALNTFGAAVGTLAAALILIPGLGNQLTTMWIASLNIGLGLLAIRLDLRQDPLPESDSAPDTAPVVDASEPVSESGPHDRLVLATLMVSGFVAMTYEVAWTRSLTAIIGSSTYAFSVMLVTFLVGIALGSTWASRYRPKASVTMLGLVQLGVAVGAVVFLVGYIVAPYLLVALIRALYYSFEAVLTIQFVVSASLMILSTFFMGATFPIAAQLYSSRIQVLGRRIGSIYSVNTVGAIFGSLLAGFILVPVIGTERTILVGLFLNSALALMLLSEARGRLVFARWAAVVLLLVSTLSMMGGVFWAPDMLDRGILVYARQFEARPNLTMSEHYADTDQVYFEEGMNASISVRRGNNYYGLRTNGKVDASNGRDMTTQLMIGLLPGFYHPNPERTLVVGYGSGVTTGAATVFPETLVVDCVEIEPAVVRAGMFFNKFNRQSYDHPKVNMIEGDARNFLNVSGQTYDVIISEPSNPWIAGVGSLFTAEFYELAASALEPGGIIAQWVQLYELSPEDVRMVMAEFQRQFPEVTVWNMGVGDLILIGSKEPLNLDVERMERIVRNDPSLQSDFLHHLSMSEPLGILSYYIMSGDRVREFSMGAERNTDDRPLLEFNAPRNLFSDTSAMNEILLNEYKTELMPDHIPEPHRERAYVAMMGPFLENGAVDLAAQIVEELALIERVNDDSLYVSLARLSLNSSLYEAVEMSLISAEDVADPQDRYAGYREEIWALMAEQQGDRGEAIERYQRALLVWPDRSDYVLKIAELYASEREWDLAATWMERYIQTDPMQLSFYWELLGEYLIASDREADAVVAFERALELEPYAYLARIRMAEVYQRRGDTDIAIESLEFLTRYAVDRDPEIYTRLADVYSEEGRWPDALRVLEKGARIFPTDTSIYTARRAAEFSSRQ